MNVSAVMCRKVVPNENLMEIGAWDIVHLNIHANVVAKIPKDIGGSANSMQTSDPASRTLKAPSNIRRQGRIPRLDCKDDSYLCAMMIMPVLLDVQQLHGPSPHAVASLERSPKLIHVNQPPLWHLKNAKGGGQFQNPHMQNCTSSCCVW